MAEFLLYTCMVICSMLVGLAYVGLLVLFSLLPSYCSSVCIVLCPVCLHCFIH